MTTLLALLSGLALQVPVAPAPSVRDLPVLRPGDAVAGRIEDGDPVVETDTLRANYTDAAVVARSFRIEVTEAGPVHVDLRSDFFDAYLVARDEQGRVLAEDDDGLVGSQSRIVLQARPGAAWRLEACALHGERGPFELSLALGAPAVLDARQRVREEIDDRRRSVDAHTQALGPEHPLVATRLNDLALLLEEQGDYAGARPLFERALAIYEKALGPDDLDVATSLNNLANLMEKQGDTAEARPLFDRSLAIYEKVLGPDHPDVATVVSNLSMVLQANGDLAGARPLLERALAIREKALGPEHPAVASGLNNLGLLLQEQGDYAGARALLERALAMREKVLGPEHPDVATSLNNLARLLKEQDDYARARSLYERSLTISEKALGPENPKVATTLNNLGLLLQAQGDHAGAKPLLERALAIWEQTLGPDHPMVATCASNLALLLMAQGDIEGARPLLEQALVIREKALGPQHTDVAMSVNNLGLLLLRKGDYAGARPLLERALAIWEKALGPEHLHVGMSLANLAGLLQAQGDYAGARPLYERSLPIFEKALGPEHQFVSGTLDLLGMLLADLGQSEEGTRLLARGEASRRLSLTYFMQRASEAEALGYMATLRWQMNLVQSPSTFVGPATAACESLLWWKGQVLRAARTGRSVLRDRIGEPGRDVVDRLQQVVAELSQAGSDVARDGEPLDGKALDRLVEERGSLERKLYALTAGLLPEVPAWSKLRDALPDHAALVDVFVHKVYETARWDGTRLVAPGRWTDPRVTAWITRRDAAEPVRVDLGAVAALEEVVRAALQRVAGGRGISLSAPIDSGSTLRQRIWDPLAPHLEGIATVIVSPDGVLGTVPFEILKGEDGRYLVEDRSFVYLTDPTDIVRMSGSPAATSGNLLAIGGVDYAHAADVVAKSNGSAPLTTTAMAPGASTSSAPASLPRGGWTDAWSPLDATQREARSVGTRHNEVFPGTEDLVLTGSAASEEQLKALLPRYGVLHIATHGYFNPDGVLSLDEAAQHEVDRGRENPAAGEETFTDVARRLQGYSPGLLSGLVCAGVNGNLSSARDDGYLTAEEVGWLDLSRVDLVVLSACDTGLGRPQSGEGLIGLRRAFLLAGAKSVISSLWSVPDQETADLMDLFYTNLWERKLGKHAALRAAQLQMIARNRERYDGDARPVTWGAFVLDGDWR